jgi:hypothetical protein
MPLRYFHRVAPWWTTTCPGADFENRPGFARLNPYAGMEWTWILPIVQGISCTIWRWAASALFYPPPPPILMRRRRLTSLLVAQGPIVSVTVAVLGFLYANHPWLLLIAVIISSIWASPPHRGKGPMMLP